MKAIEKGSSIAFMALFGAEKRRNAEKREVQTLELRT